MGRGDEFTFGHNGYEVPVRHLIEICGTSLKMWVWAPKRGLDGSFWYATVPEHKPIEFAMEKQA